MPLIHRANDYTDYTQHPKYNAIAMALRYL